MTILVGYLDTDAGHAALDRAIIEANTANAKLVVVNGSREAIRSDAHRLDTSELDALGTKLLAAGIDADIRHPQSEEDTAEQILAIAEEEKVDLVVIGIRRRTPIAKFFLGSTAQKVILDAPCPVLCVKADA